MYNVLGICIQGISSNPDKKHTFELKLLHQFTNTSCTHVLLHMPCFVIAIVAMICKSTTIIITLKAYYVLHACSQCNKKMMPFEHFHFT